ncbi:MAG: bifunctional lysylphosphatidylglycerol flippase/synthetase MprF, partial [Pseudomonadota bacterium]
MGGLVFCAGVILLLSGATPPLPYRLIWLEKMLPLPLIEFSHFLGSLVGTALLFLAVGMFKRLDASYFLTLFLLAFGALFSILKGLDYEEAVVLGTLFFLLLPCHRYFNRQASLLAAGFSGAWFMAIFLAISSSIWLGFFAYRHVEYDHELWWEFSFDGDAPRFLRAMVGTQLIVLLFALAKLFKTRPPDDHATLQESPELIKNLVRSSPNTTATLALLGDKYFFFNQKKNAFIMYALSGQSWVTLSDPVGAEEEFPELIWLFTERANHYGFRPIFYQITDRYLPLYIDLGMILLKIGEEAMMPLKDFSLEGRQGKKLRLNRNRLIDEGFQFSIVPVNQVPTILPVMESISNQWLSHKSAREKGFSIGYFDKNYLLNFPVALIKKGEQAVAFANILEGANKEELSVDLMRFIPEVGHGLMDYLFAELFLWGKEQGLARFNIGMAPLSGLSNRPMATWWHKLGKIVYEYGEHFYNFQGLRDYKEKFHPVWESRYIAAPGAFSLPAALANIATLVSRGIKGIWAK